MNISVIAATRKQALARAVALQQALGGRIVCKPYKPVRRAPPC